MTNNHDKLIKKIFWNFDTNQGSFYYRKFNQKFNKYPNIYNYLNNRFNDSESIYESLLRLVFNIFNRPVCPICGNKLNFIGKPNNKGIYRKTCSKSCSCKYTNNFNCHIKESQLKAKQTKLKRYNNENYNNREKTIKTNKEKYGVETTFQNKEIQEKGKLTKLKKYGDENYNNINKIKQTKLNHYGNENFVNIDKAKQTKLQKYGNENYINTNKIKQTLLNKYGIKAGFNNGKDKLTKLERYNNENYNNIEKNKQTCLKKYGVDSYSKTNQFKEYMLKNKHNIQEKRNNTKRKNNTFNTSKPENESYQLLKEKYPDIIYQYRSKEYPFNCDFYIPSLDLYIECNYHWTHGDHPYNKESKEDNIILEKWKEKNTKFYNNAIKTWTIRDVEKYNIAKKNNLNYLLFYNIDELKNWINKEKNK